MPTKAEPGATLTTVAEFPKEYFLESIVVRKDGSMLVTVFISQELWYVPPPHEKLPMKPVRIHSFAQPALGLVEVEHDVFYVVTSNVYTSHKSYLHKLDLRGWTPTMRVAPAMVLEFPKTAGGLNGACLIAPHVILIADSVAGLIWLVDVAEAHARPTAREWLKHDTMNFDLKGSMPDQPGVNGVQYAARTKYLYYTSTAQQLFMRVRVNPETLDPAGEPEFVSGGMMGDDFCIDENAGVAYVATHRQNTIDRISLEPSLNTGARHSVAGDPFDPDLIGPTNGVWGRAPGDYGRLAYFLTDGGTKAPPPDGICDPQSYCALSSNT